MTLKLEKTALMIYLKERNDLYYGKILELLNAVQGWLEYVPQSFPHYTRHTIQHSEEIIIQLSKLLFKDDDPSEPVVKLSAVETYILIVSAYLHDVGMVVSDNEKLEILSSEEWNQWTKEKGAGHKRWVQIEEFRKSSTPSDETIRNFLADIQIRFLLAEFFRRQHHLRSRKIITVHQYALGRFALGDPLLLQTIVNVCVSHGMRQDELEDGQQYPDRCDIQGEKVNIRFLAILLRIGDLLDMSHERACPLLLNAASPLPPESLAHWSKYKRITHRMTAPDKIELSAECHNQEEHRFLQDWCQWLVEELREAAVVMSRAARHNHWVPPKCSLEGPNRTINIKPAQEAKYIPSKWTFDLDEKVVFQRLMKDIYRDPMAFLLELVQNALDATRCQMYLDLENDGLELPEYPTQVEEDRRFRYPVKITLGTTELSNELSGETETRQLLTIEDCGIGMDREIIQRFFLQIGRSYYQTEEFRRRFKFVPSSKLGIGFLSVFAVSDHVTVETYKPSSQSAEGSIRLTLRGPRNYLLTERGDRQSCGTCIKVLFRKPIERGSLIEKLEYWCKRVEFPIVVDDLGAERTIFAERAEQFLYEIPDLSEEGARLTVRAFPINRRGIEGELYIFARVNSKGESWNMRHWAFWDYPKTHPAAHPPPFPNNLVCRNGIRNGIKTEFIPIDAEKMGIKEGYRLDIRCKVSRDTDIWPILREVMSSRVEEILKEHVTTDPRVKLPDGWSYKQSLINDYPVTSFWYSCPETIRIHTRGQASLTLLKDLLNLPIITVTLDLTNPHLYFVHYCYYERKLDVKEPIFDNTLPTLTDTDLNLISEKHRASIFADRKPNNIRWIKSNHLAIDWELGAGAKCDLLNPPGIELGGRRLIDLGRRGLIDHKTLESLESLDFDIRFYRPSPTYLVELPEPDTIALYIHPTIVEGKDPILFNQNNAFVKWLLKLRDSYLESSHLEEKEFIRLLLFFQNSIRYHHRKEFHERLQQYCNWLNTSKKLPEELNPPQLKFNERMFILRHPSWARKNHAQINPS